MSRFRLAVAAGSLAALTAGVLAGLAPPASAAPPRPVPGAPGIGDPLFPGLGNGGYDATHYGIDLTYHADTRLVDAVTTMQARADQALTRFDLDFDGNTVRSVRFDGQTVAFTREGSELIITPQKISAKEFRMDSTVHLVQDGDSGVNGAATKAALNYLDSLTGEVPRSANRTLEFGRLDVHAGKNDSATLSYSRARLNSPAGSGTGASAGVVARGAASCWRSAEC